MANMCLFSCKVIKAVISESTSLSRMRINNLKSISVRYYTPLIRSRDCPSWRINQNCISRWTSASAVGQFRSIGTKSEIQTISSDSEILTNHEVALSIDNIPDLTDALSSAVAAAEPTLASLGLGGWYPPGPAWIQSGLEFLHTGLDVPWWTAIVISTVCLRLMVFPLVIMAQRNAANMHNHMPTMQRLQQRMIEVRSTGDTQQLLKAHRELTDYMARYKINPMKNLIPPFAQLPIFLSVFSGIRQMANLPVASMQTGGMLWFTDLTVCDPYFALPLMTCATLYLTIELGVDGIRADQAGSAMMKKIFRVLPIITFPFMLQFPAALLCYWLTSNVISLLQVLFLKIPQVREFFKIPTLVNHNLATNIKEREGPQPGFMESFRQAMNNSELARQMQERERYNALRLKESTRSLSTTRTNQQNNSSRPAEFAQSEQASQDQDKTVELPQSSNPQENSEIKETDKPKSKS